MVMEFTSIGILVLCFAVVHFAPRSCYGNAIEGIPDMSVLEEDFSEDENSPGEESAESVFRGDGVESATGNHLLDDVPATKEVLEGKVDALEKEVGELKEKLDKQTTQTDELLGVVDIIQHKLTLAEARTDYVIELVLEEEMTIEHGNKTHITGMATINGRIYVAIQGQESISVYDAENLTRLDDIQMPVSDLVTGYLYRINIFSCNETNSLYVLDINVPRRLIIWKLDIDDGKVSFWKEEALEFDRSLTVSVSNCHVLVSKANRRNMVSLTLYNQDGVPVRTAVVALSVSPGQIVESKSGTFIVIEDDVRSVLEVSGNGKVINSMRRDEDPEYDGEDFKNRWPVVSTTDALGYYYVVYSNNSYIAVVDKYLSRSQRVHLARGGVDKILYDAHNRRIVTLSFSQQPNLQFYRIKYCFGPN